MVPLRALHSRNTPVSAIWGGFVWRRIWVRDAVADWLASIYAQPAVVLEQPSLDGTGPRKKNYKKTVRDVVLSYPSGRVCAWKPRSPRPLPPMPPAHGFAAAC